MNPHEVNMSKFMLLIDLEYITFPLFLNIFLDSAYTKRERNPFFKDLGEVEGREMIILLLMIEICLNNANIQVTKFNQLDCKGFYNPFFFFFFLLFPPLPVGTYI